MRASLGCLPILAQAGAVRFCSAETPASGTETLTATRPGVLIIAAPGAAMDPGAQDTATPLVVNSNALRCTPSPACRIRKR